jgi:hypothetical protein
VFFLLDAANEVAFLCPGKFARWTFGIERFDSVGLRFLRANSAVWFEREHYKSPASLPLRLIQKKGTDHGCRNVKRAEIGGSVIHALKASGQSNATPFNRKYSEKIDYQITLSAS